MLWKMAVTNLLTRPSLALPIIALLVWLSYLVGIVVYRLYLSPIAKFPGPKLAALTKWYEFYYEVIRKGQFTFHIDELHNRYGTCMRLLSCIINSFTQGPSFESHRKSFISETATTGKNFIQRTQRPTGTNGLPAGLATIAPSLRRRIMPCIAFVVEHSIRCKCLPYRS